MSGNAIPTIDRDSYSAVLSSYLPLPIRNEADNERALSQVEVLLNQESLTQAETDLLELLTQLIERFEAEQYTFPIQKQAAPLKMLRFLMESNNLKQADLVDVIGSRGVISEVFNGKRNINKAMAIALGKRFNVDAELFIASSQRSSPLATEGHVKKGKGAMG